VAQRPVTNVFGVALGVCALMLQPSMTPGGRSQTAARPDGRTVRIADGKQSFRIESVTTGLETPWALAFLPDHRLLVTERPGRLRIIEAGKLLPEPVEGIPSVWERQDGGLFDVAIHPQYSRTGWIYLSYSEPGPNETSMTAIVRGRIKGNRWSDQQFLFHAPPELYTASNIHYGSRLLFDPQGHLFFSIGERGSMDDAQDLSKPTGKIHRVNDDGTIPPDNPFVGRQGALPSIWSYGHRNPQGLAIDPATGRIWETEHGPKGGDELNLIEPGHNYGWPVITSGIQAGVTKTSQSGMEQPVIAWTPTFAPSGMTFYSGDRYPAWRGSLFVCGLASQQLRRIEVRGDKVTRQEVVLDQVGRVRDIAVGPDGYLYLALQQPGERLFDSTPGSIVRLVP
jgi:glucose/arabinose dehydrogenase